jgi:hypothetical protein
VTDVDPARDFQIQIARLEHALGRVSAPSTVDDELVSAAEQLAQVASDADAALDRVLRGAGGTR